MSKPKKLLLKSISAFFVFWLSSVLVLVCCGSHFFITSISANTSVEEEMSCPLGSGEHDCCKKKSGGKTFSEYQEDKADCCVFKPQKTLSADLQNLKNVKQSQILTEKVETPKPTFFIKQIYKPNKIYHSAIRNRGSTYLQNCNFRI